MVTPRSLALLLLLFLLALPALGQGGPPLLTDDPDTPGNRHWEINTAITVDHTAAITAYETPIVDLNYGWGNRLQLKFELPWVVQDVSGVHTGGDLGNSLAGVKWRFYEDSKGSFSLSTYPQFGFNNPTDSLRRGLVDSGNLFLLPLELSKKFGPVRGDLEVGYEFNQHQPDGVLAGAVLAREIGRLELLGETHYGGVITGTPRQAVADLGGRLKLGGPLVLLFMAGHSYTRSSHFIGYLGLQLQLPKPKDKD